MTSLENEILYVSPLLQKNNFACPTLPRKVKLWYVIPFLQKKNGKTWIFHATPKTISTSLLFLGTGATFPRKSWMESCWVGIVFFQHFRRCFTRVMCYNGRAITFLILNVFEIVADFERFRKCC